MSASGLFSITILACAVGLNAAHVGAQTTDDIRPEVSDIEGVWFSGYRRGQEEISVELTAIREIGLLSVQFKRWQPVGSANCRYFLDLKQPSEMTPVLNGSWGTPESCPQDFTLSFHRTGAESAQLEIGNAAFLDRAEMTAGLRPIRPIDRRAAISGLDVLGLAPGETQSVLEAKLTALGFVPLSYSPQTLVSRDSSWSRDIHHYGRQPGDDGQFGETISISLSSVIAAEPNEPRAVVISRFQDIPEADNVAERTIIEALSQKYGPPIDTSENRRWDRQGRHLTTYAARRENCQTGSMQVFDYRHPTPQQDEHLKVNPYCGPEADILVITDGVRARTLTIKLVDPDEVWDDFWWTWSLAEYAKIKSDFEAISGANGSAPDL